MEKSEERVAIRNFRDLRVWQTAMDLVEQTYLLTQTFPKHETYGLASQMQRAAVSIPSNIAEGHTRGYTKEYVHHLSMARASLAELQTQLEIVLRLKYTSPDKIARLIERTEALAKPLSALRNALSRKTNS